MIDVKWTENMNICSNEHEPQHRAGVLKWGEQMEKLVQKQL